MATILKSQQRLKHRIQESISSSNSNTDTISIQSISSFRSAVSFRRELLETGVYRFIRANKSTASFKISTAQSGGTLLTQLTKASRIAVIHLPINVRELPVGFPSVSSGLYDISGTFNDDLNTPTTSLNIISLEELLKLKVYPTELKQRLLLGLMLVKSMPKLIKIWPQNWGKRDIYFHRIPLDDSIGMTEDNKLVKKNSRIQSSVRQSVPSAFLPSELSTSDYSILSESKSETNHSYEPYLKSLGKILFELHVASTIESISKTYNDPEQITQYSGDCCPGTLDYVGYDGCESYMGSVNACMLASKSKDEEDMKDYLNTSIETRVIPWILQELESCPTELAKDYLVVPMNTFETPREAHIH
ncbi:hypothetical protein FPQ18DRAFT_302082 [Pyronema domesticum]|nr:hypothetical protein FPQ18DRAFT_302082 [Pyronema domesticum]